MYTLVWKNSNAILEFKLKKKLIITICAINVWSDTVHYPLDCVANHVTIHTVHHQVLYLLIIQHLQKLHAFLLLVCRDMEQSY